MAVTSRTVGPLRGPVAGIEAAGFYIPRHLIKAEALGTKVGGVAAETIEERSVPAFDEDEVTIAVEAGGRALAAARNPRVDVLAYATSGPAGAGALVAEALGVDPAKARDVFGSPDAGETALAGAIDGASRDGTSTLVIATEGPRVGPRSPEDEPSGAAAVALLVTPAGKVGWRRGSAPSRSVLARWIGDAGAASVLLSFLTSLDPSDVKGDIDIGRALKARTAVTYEQYAAVRRHGPPPPGTEYSQGAYVSQTTYLAEKKARYRLVGERCTKCGRLHFPPRESCLGCGAASWEDVPLKRAGKVYAFTIIGKGAAPSEFLEQQLAVGDYATAVVELEDGPRVAAMLTDVDPATVKIGMPVRMVFRRLYKQEGATRYGFKFAPA